MVALGLYVVVTFTEIRQICTFRKQNMVDTGGCVTECMTVQIFKKCDTLCKGKKFISCILFFFFLWPRLKIFSSELASLDSLTFYIFSFHLTKLCQLDLKSIKHDY